jgi:hypothetical protein
LDEDGLKSFEAKQVLYFQYSPIPSSVIWICSIHLYLEAEFCFQMASVLFTVKPMCVGHLLFI